MGSKTNTLPGSVFIPEAIEQQRLLSGKAGQIPSRTILRESDIERSQREGLMGRYLGYQPTLSPEEISARRYFNQSLSMPTDPYSVPGFKILTNQIQQEANKAQQNSADVLRSNFSMGGTYGGSVLNNQLEQLAQLTSQDVTNKIGDLAYRSYYDNLANQRSVLPYANQFGEVERQFPLTQLGLAEKAYSLSGVPRGIDQKIEDEKVDSAMRQFNALRESFGNTPAILSGSQNSYINEPGIFGEYIVPSLAVLGPLLQGISAFTNSGYGGTMGQGMTQKYAH